MCKHMIVLLPIFTKDSDEITLTKKQRKEAEELLKIDYIGVQDIFKWYKWAKVSKYTIVEYNYKNGEIQLCLNRAVTTKDMEHFLSIIETGDDTWREGNIEILPGIELDLIIQM